MGDTYVRVSGAARKVADAYRKVGGVWVPATELHALVPVLKQSKQVFNAEVVVAAQAAGIQSLSEIFNAAQSGLWASTKRKRLLVNLARGPLLIDSDFGGELTIEVVAGGVISGNGGAGSTALGTAGAAGGAAINVLSNVTKKALLVNNGIIRGGGGGGGKGGTGGQGGAGLYQQSVTEGPFYSRSAPLYLYTIGGGFSSACWNSSSANVYSGSGSPNPITQGIYTYYRGSRKESGKNGSITIDYYELSRTYIADVPTIGGVGGAGGNGGRGIGWDGARANGVNGAGGAAGGQNAGTGGTGGAGGNGGDWGAAGSNAAMGNTGGAGNNGGGAGGGAATTSGAGGRAVLGYARLIYEGSGLLIGGTS